MIVVTGCPRSGTSLMMQCLRAGLGKDRLFGEEFPMIAQRERFEQKRDDETDEQYAYRMFVYRSMNDNVEAEEKKSMLMNPKGFWECPFTVAGISWRPGIDDQIRKFKQEISGHREQKNESFCKIVSQGVAKSDPSFISKMILMVRPPREVAKSQERLKREFQYTRRDGRGKRNLFSGMKIHSPKMFIDVSLILAEWLKRNSDIQVLVVEYENLIKSPEKILEDVFDFLLEGNADKKAKKAAKAIDKSLKRSYPEPKESLLWNDAEAVHGMLLAKDWKAMETFSKDKNRPSYKEDFNWICLRSKTRMVEAHCRRCYSDPEFAKTIRRAATAHGIEWRLLPCAWEVAFNPDGPLKSIDDSITENHWWTDDDQKKEEFEIVRREQIKAQKLKGK